MVRDEKKEYQVMRRGTCSMYGQQADMQAGNGAPRGNARCRRNVEWLDYRGQVLDPKENSKSFFVRLACRIQGL